jgi:hypothetical protein
MEMRFLLFFSPLARPHTRETRLTQRTLALQAYTLHIARRPTVNSTVTKQLSFQTDYSLPQTLTQLCSDPAATLLYFGLGQASIGRCHPHAPLQRCFRALCPWLSALPGLMACLTLAICRSNVVS